MLKAYQPRRLTRPISKRSVTSTKWVGTTRPALGLWDFLGALLLSGRRRSWKYLQTVALRVAGGRAEKLRLQYLPGAVLLLRPKNVKSYRSRDEIGQLQPFGVGALLGNHEVQRIRKIAVVVSIAHATKRKFHLLVFLLSASFAHDGQNAILLPLQSKEVLYSLESESQSQMIGVLGRSVLASVLHLINHDRVLLHHAHRQLEPVVIRRWRRSRYAKCGAELQEPRLE
jgi:hypothetical protein